MKLPARKKTLFLLPLTALALVMAENPTTLSESTVSGGDNSSMESAVESAACPSEPSQDYGQKGNTQEKPCSNVRVEPVLPGAPPEAPGFMLDPEAMINRTEIQEPGMPNTEEGQAPLPETPVESTKESR